MNNILYFAITSTSSASTSRARASISSISIRRSTASRDYNLLFKTPKGHASEAQITAFEDSWHWGEQAEHEFEEILHQADTDAAEMIRSLRRFLHENDMLAYVVMMCRRLLELHRVLKPTGSLYLHCDPTASHYIKMILDAV